MGDTKYLGEFEQMVLLAALQHDDDAHAPAIAHELEKSAGRAVSRGALYSALGRLEKKGLLRWAVEAHDSDSQDRGGYPKRRFAVTEEGLEALRESRDALMNLWRGLDDVLARQSR